MKVLVVSSRIPSPYYGEDRLLMLLMRILVKHGNEVYIHILSRNAVLKLEKVGRVKLVTSYPKHVDVVLLHHDVSLIKYSLIHNSMHRAPVIGLIYFIDKYTSTSLLRNIVGWFVAQGLAYLVTFSRKVYSELRRFCIRRVMYMPLVHIYRKKCSINAQRYGNRSNAIRICYIGVADDERLNVKEIARLAYKLHKFFGKRIEMCIVSRPDQRIREVDTEIRQWLRVVVIKQFLTDEEKTEFLRKCDVAMFTAKRIRFVVPPLFVVEAHSCGCLVYAPHLATMLREEGLDNVYSSIDELVDAIRKLMT